ncbi:uncharacterized protein [Palaemon carinicauda]|uniref:uncharacterized protein n=1 Tax=Palaemon carinicauda TaxID=392227 RepID=UPI0035B5E952
MPRSSLRKVTYPEISVTLPEKFLSAIDYISEEKPCDEDYPLLSGRLRSTSAKSPSENDNYFTYVWVEAATFVDLESISSGAATQLLPVRHIRRAIRRYKQAAGAPHPIPSNLADMVIPSEYKKTSSGEDFLLYDSGLIEQRILLFSTPTNISLLEKSDNWFGDGTFKIVPELFYQLYTIHCLTSERVILCVYALLPNKRQAAYEDILQNLLTINPRLHPKTFLIDFEQAARSAIEEIFPNVTVKGCLYHLSQSIYRKVQNEGLQTKYQTDANFSLQIHMIPALAFVPAEKVIEAFEKTTRDVAHLRRMQ